MNLYKHVFQLPDYKAQHLKLTIIRQLRALHVQGYYTYRKIQYHE